MATFSWSDVINNNKNSVVHIHSTVKTYDCTKPYIANDTVEVHGTGFIVDIHMETHNGTENDHVHVGLIVTNYAVVKNAISVSGFIPLLSKTSLRLEVVSVCPLYELALLKISQQDLQDIVYAAIEDPRILNLEFDDSMYSKEGEQVLSIGYDTQSDTLQCSSSAIVGTLINKKSEYNIQYLRITDSLPKSKCGAPIFNSSGKIIGLSSADDMCIPSRLLLCVYSAMLSNTGIFTPPISGLTYGNTNQDFINNKTGTSTDEAIVTGVYVRSIHKNSFLDLIDKGNIISGITYKDPFVARDKIVSLRYEFFTKGNGHVEPELRILLGDNFEEFRNSKGEVFPDRLDLTETDIEFPTVTITAHVNNYGYVQLYELSSDEISDKLESTLVDESIVPIIDKSFKLEELFCMLPLGAELGLKVHHLDYKGQTGWFENTATFASENTCILDGTDYTFTEPRFEVVAGCCFTSINLDIIDKFKINNSKHNVVISHIFQNTSIYKVGDFLAGDIVISINNREIKGMHDVRTAMKNCPVFFNMKTKNDKEFICAREDMLVEDLSIIKSYKIHNYVHPLSEREDDRIVDPGKPVKQLRKLK